MALAHKELTNDEESKVKGEEDWGKSDAWLFAGLGESKATINHNEGNERVRNRKGFHRREFEKGPRLYKTPSKGFEGKKKRRVVGALD